MCYHEVVQSTIFSTNPQGLALTPEDAWCVHSVAHVYEMKAEVEKGLKFMESTEKDWAVGFHHESICCMLCHSTPQYGLVPDLFVLTCQLLEKK